LRPQAPEEALLRLLDDLHLGVLLIDPQLVEGRFLGLLDSSSGRLDPFHCDLLPLLLLTGPGVRLGCRRRPAGCGLLVLRPGPGAGRGALAPGFAGRGPALSGALFLRFAGAGLAIYRLPRSTTAAVLLRVTGFLHGLLGLP